MGISLWVHPRPVRLGFTLLSHSVRMDEDRLQVPASHRRGLCTMRAMTEIEWLDGRVVFRQEGLSKQSIGI